MSLRALDPGQTGDNVFLGVTRSATGRRWERRLADDGDANAMVQQHGLPELLARVLSARGVSPDETESFLDPKLKTLLPEPDSLPDMAAAAARIADAVQAGEAIVVFGDYDVDGATGTSLLLRLLRALGVEASFYIPDRETEGYGPNPAAIDKLVGGGARLMITVDCGATAFDALAHAARRGLDVIVLDHHQGETDLPAACAVVNPNRADAADVGRQLAAVGVCFVTAIAVTRELRRRGFFASRQEPDLMALLDLVALGTVADVVPLTGVNRAFVRQGLKVLTQRRNPGLNALLGIARLNEAPAPYHLGFVLGPRINAGGRLGGADLGTRLLSTDDAGEAGALALKLDEMNRQRRAIEQRVLAEAMAQIEAVGNDRPLVWACAPDWPVGVIGIVAGRLKERYRRPALVIGLDATGEGKGSARSIPGVDLGAIIRAARRDGLLLAGGGHAMAAGLSVTAENLAALEERLQIEVGAALDVAPARDRLGLDGAVTASGITTALFDDLARAGPFGAGQPQPRLAVPAVTVWQADLRSGGHVAVRLGDSGGGSLRAIAFRAADGPLGELLLARGHGRPVHLAGHLSSNTWNGQRRVELVVEDAAPASRS
ncbi:MAG: single-stranded-DNA-specific exonuclease RecJ [Alphaproteobacteria bacterium]